MLLNSNAALARPCCKGRMARSARHVGGERTPPGRGRSMARSAVAGAVEAGVGAGIGRGSGAFGVTSAATGRRMSAATGRRRAAAGSLWPAPPSPAPSRPASGLALAEAPVLSA